MEFATACCSAASVLSRVESSGCGGDHRHEPVVLSLKPLVVLGHLGAKAGVELVKALLRSEQSFVSKIDRDARY